MLVRFEWHIKMEMCVLGVTICLMHNTLYHHNKVIYGIWLFIFFSSCAFPSISPHIMILFYSIELQLSSGPLSFTIPILIQIVCVCWILSKNIKKIEFLHLSIVCLPFLFNFSCGLFAFADIFYNFSTSGHSLTLWIT